MTMIVTMAKNQRRLLEFLRNTGVIADPGDDLTETFTSGEIAEFERHLLEEADEFLGPPQTEDTESGEK
jgi:hypothetical protein